MMNYKTMFWCGFGITVFWLLRGILSGELVLGFIVWNIFLASIPVLLEPVFAIVRRRLDGIVAFGSKALLAAVWLLFLPNAFYILTDFMHLNADVLVNARGDHHRTAVHYVRGDGVYVFDSLLLLTATLYGAYYGGIALVHAFEYLKRRFSQTSALALMGGIMVLSGVGVYIGRFGRWNSWQGLIHPWRIISDLADSLAKPALRERFLWVVLAMVIFQCLSFGCIRAIQHWPIEQKD